MEYPFDQSGKTVQAVSVPIFLSIPRLLRGAQQEKEKTWMSWELFLKHGCVISSLLKIPNTA